MSGVKCNKRERCANKCRSKRYCESEQSCNNNSRMICSCCTNPNPCSTNTLCRVGATFTVNVSSTGVITTVPSFGIGYNITVTPGVGIGSVPIITICITDPQCQNINLTAENLGFFLGGLPTSVTLTQDRNVQNSNCLNLTLRSNFALPLIPGTTGTIRFNATG